MPKNENNRTVFGSAITSCLFVLAIVYCSSANAVVQNRYDDTTKALLADQASLHLIIRIPSGHVAREPVEQSHSEIIEMSHVTNCYTIYDQRRYEGNSFFWRQIFYAAQRFCNPWGSKEKQD
jgi:hypothetical protein